MKQADQNTKPASVYLMRCEDYLKIGVAVSVGWRQVSMQTGNPFELKIVGQRLFPTFGEATRAEASLHAKFKEQRHRGEWFRLDDAEAVAALEAYGQPQPKAKPVPRPAFKMPDFDWVAVLQDQWRLMGETDPATGLPDRSGG